MTEKTTETKKIPSLGLEGIWGNVGNLSAIAVLILVFYQVSSELLTQAKEDRVMFREELRRLGDQQNQSKSIIERNERTIEMNNEILRTNQKLMLQVSEALRDVATGLKSKSRE